jgi:peptidoglycan/LPS O-acetylase OafA/YrhL
VTRRLLFLNGLAILTIPIHHAGAYGLQAMFFWTDRYRPVSVPNYDLLGSIPFYITMIVRQLDTFSVPAFLFISGFFIAFMAKGKEKTLTWQMVLPRVKVLLIPFIIWTIIRYALLRHVPTSVDEVLDPYHFIPILIQFYLISPLLVPMARNRWKLLLIVAAVLHLSIHTLRYLSGLDVILPGQELILSLTPRWFFLGQQPFWFPFGLVFGLHLQQHSQQLARMKWQLLAATIISAILMVAEYQIGDYLNGLTWVGPSFSGLTKNFYIFFFILLILAINESSFPRSKDISNLGAKSLGIYMGNIPAIYVTAVLMYHFTPWALGSQLLYQTILAIAGLGGPLLLMWLVRQTPLRAGYRYLFG